MTQSWQDLRVLIAGCGSIGRRHARVLAGLGLRDLRACDPLPAQRAALLAETPAAQLYPSFEAGLAERPDAVLICTPPAMHIPMAMEAIRAGCHVLCEKPLSDRSAGIDDLEALAERERRKVMVALCFRYHEGLLRARDMLRSGRIGRLISIRALMGEHLPEVRPDYRTLFSAQQGGAFDLMHEIDLAIWYAARPVSRVLAISGNYSDIGLAVQAPEGGAPDLAELLIDFADPTPGGEGRCLASIHLDFFQRPRRRQFELIGSQGVIIVEFARWDRCTISVYEANLGAWQEQTFSTERDDMFRAEDEEFLRAVAGDLPIACTIAEGRQSVEVVEKARGLI